MNISLIAAISKNNVIGKDNKLLWKLKTDMKFFRTTTTGHCIIMGRKTFESFGAKPLPNRTNIVVTRDKGYKAPEGVKIVESLESALSIAHDTNEKNEFPFGVVDKEIFIIGGGELYKESIKLANKMYITHVDVDIEGDTYFPAIDPQVWKLVSSEPHAADDLNEYPFVIGVYERIEVYMGKVTDFNDLQNEFFGEPGSPERDAYEAEYINEVKKLKDLQ